MNKILKASSEAATEAIASLKEGGVVLLPTDTVYGLAVHPDFPEAVDRLYAMKDRPRNMNLPIMVADVADMEALGVAINAPTHRLLNSDYVPGALTIAIGFVDAPKVAWLEGRDEVAIRIPDDEHLLAILRATGPLLVTSANASGHDTPTEVAAILEQLHVAPDVAIDGGTIPTIPSTLVNCRVNPPVIEREGVIPATDLAPYLK